MAIIGGIHYFQTNPYTVMSDIWFTWTCHPSFIGLVICENLEENRRVLAMKDGRSWIFALSNSGNQKECVIFMFFSYSWKEDILLALGTALSFSTSFDKYDPPICGLRWLLKKWPISTSKWSAPKQKNYGLEQEWAAISMKWLAQASRQKIKVQW